MQHICIVPVTWFRYFVLPFCVQEMNNKPDKKKVYFCYYILMNVSDIA